MWVAVETTRLRFKVLGGLEASRLQNMSLFPEDAWRYLVSLSLFRVACRVGGGGNHPIALRF